MPGPTPPGSTRRDSAARNGGATGSSTKGRRRSKPSPRKIRVPIAQQLTALAAAAVAERRSGQASGAGRRLFRYVQGLLGTG